MSEKVKLAREVVERIEFCAEKSSFETILKAHRDEQRLPRVLNELEFDQLARALYIGYEIEETPEDKVREYFKEATKLKAIKSDNSLCNTPSTEYVKYASKVETIIHVLDILNIKIKGVNDREA